MLILAAMVAFADDKQDRETLDGVVSSAGSENFVLKWGAAGEPDPADVDGLLTGLELAWAVEFDALGFDAPLGSTVYRINVYLANTGLSGPFYGDVVMAEPLAGMASFDSEGFPIIVVGDYVLGDPWLEVVTAHELFHLSQFASLNYQGDADLWWWEATAAWAQREVYADRPETVSGLWPLHFQPHLALENSIVFDRPDDPMQVAEFSRAYGVGTFARYVSEQHGTDVIQETWNNANGHDRPLSRLGEILEDEHQTSLAAVAHEWSVANVTWDYEDPDITEARMEQEWAEQVENGWDPGLRDVLDHSTTFTVPGDRDWYTPDAALRPARFGSNRVVLEQPVDPRVRIELSGDPTGSEGTPVEWWATALAMDADGELLGEARLEEGEATLDGVDEADRVVVVITAATETFDPDEVFDYQLRLEQKRRGVCATATGPGWLALFALVALRRRKEQT